MVILSHFLHLFDGLLHHEVVVLSSKLLLFVHESEDENIVILGLKVDNTFYIFIIIIKLEPDVHVFALLALHDHKLGAVIAGDSVSELLANVVTNILNNTLDVGLARDLVLELLIQVVALALPLDFLARDLLAETGDLVHHDELLLLG